MVHAGATYSRESVKYSTEVLNIPRTASNFPRWCEICHAGGQMVLGGAKYSTDNAKCSTEVLSIPRIGANGPRRC